jgi:hypothetical protein
LAYIYGKNAFTNAATDASDAPPIMKRNCVTPLATAAGDIPQADLMVAADLAQVGQLGAHGSFLLGVDLRFVLDQVFQVVQPGVDVIPQVVQLFADQLRL